jgi:hypothetical protein
MTDLQWKWEIEPPLSVKGLHPESGIVDGSESDARQAAKKAIDQQTRWLWAGAGSPAPAPIGTASDRF